MKVSQVVLGMLVYAFGCLEIVKNLFSENAVCRFLDACDV